MNIEGFIPSGSRRGVAFGLVVALLIGAGLSSAACGGDDGVSSAAVEPTTAPTQELVSTPQPASTSAEERPWAFRGQRGITAAFPPADLALYRSLLPEPLDMPDEPLVVMSVVYYYDVTPPLVPYREGYVLLQCEHQGRTGWHVLTMPVDDETADAGGRAIGFPKYVADQITLEQQDGGWTGRVVRDGRTVLEIAFTPAAGAQPVTATRTEEGDTVFNVAPSGEGSTVLEVVPDPSGPRTTVTTSGSATVSADPEEPWAGLVAGEGAPVWAAFEEMTGDWTLQATELP
jgi:hypothetical protein